LETSAVGNISQVHLIFFVSDIELAQFLYCILYWMFVVGLDAAGKTTILYKLKLGEIVTTIPTIGNMLL